MPLTLAFEDQGGLELEVRVRDPGDRRRVLIEPTTEGIDRVRAYWAGLATGTRDNLAESTETELAVLLRFVQRSRRLHHAEPRLGDQPFLVERPALPWIGRQHASSPTGR